MIEDLERAAWLVAAGLVGWWIGQQLGWGPLEGLLGVLPL